MTHPTHGWFHKTVSALADSVARSHEKEPEAGPRNDDLIQFIIEQHARMPDYLRTPMMLAALGFDLAGMAKHGKTFHKQSAAERERQLARWRTSNVGFKRDLVRYFESLATLAL